MDNLAAAGLILASASPRRRTLLESVGLRPTVMAADIDETVPNTEPPVAALRRLAEAKADAVYVQAVAANTSHRALLAADTGVLVDGRLLGKPSDAADAARMLRALRGRTHHVVTAVCLIAIERNERLVTHESTALRFRRYSDSLIAGYAASDEPKDKAGAYAIQGVGALLCEAMFGSWSNVVGLPVERLPDWFRTVGLELEAFLVDL
ncbi:MAG: Maf family protein [Acidobacteriota bacterium]|nr:Maf family protein [Acidobacteriota bacterium]MDH3784623.1 Maf family protein [Acidobacteriota bacterium]